MYNSNSGPQNGHAGPTIPPNMPPSLMNSNNGRNRNDNRRLDYEEVVLRPIIKEEDLKSMDDLTRDKGWAVHDDIDYK